MGLVNFIKAPLTLLLLQKSVFEGINSLSQFGIIQVRMHGNIGGRAGTPVSMVEGS